MNKPEEQKDSKAPGHTDNQGRRQRASTTSAPDQEEQHQRTRELAPSDQERQSGGTASGSAESAQGDRSTAEREERIRNRAYRYWEDGGRHEGQAEEHWHRAAQDLDREDAELQRTGAGSAKDSGRDRS